LQLKKLFSDLRNNFNDKELTIVIDTITGFPGESDNDFEKTKKFSLNYNILTNNVSQFWSMPFTKAHKMKQLPTEIKKQRSKELSALARQNYNNMLKKYVGKTVFVYFNDIDSKGNYLAKTRNYISVVLKSPKKKPNLGVWYKYKVKAIENYHLLC